MKTYRYRSHVRVMRNALPVFLGIIGVALVIIFFLIPISIMWIGLGVFLIAEAVFLGFVLRRMSNVSASIDDDVLIYKHGRGTLEIPFESILGLKFPSMRYLGGWLKVVTKDRSVRLTIVLERIDQFVLELKKALDQKDMAAKYDLKRLQNFYKTVVFGDQSWGRLYSHFWRMFFTVVFLGCVGAVIGHFVGSGRQIILVAVLFGMVSVLYGLSAYLVTETVFAIHVRQKLKTAPLAPMDRDVSYENKIYRYILIPGAIIYALVAAFFMVMILS